MSEKSHAFNDKLNNFGQYRCPLCSMPLLLVGASFKCDNNHSFDKAKEGYVNLLPVQFKHSKDPGDNKAMVRARRSFLEQQFYAPLVNRITELMNEHAPTVTNVLDAGCGEGYYTHQHKTADTQVYGVDIAKEAVKIAAKKYKDCHFSVGTLSQLPFEDQFFDWVYSIYAPILEEEFTRVLAKDAYLLTVTPAENHLLELKQLIYREAKTHDTTKQPIENLSLVHEEKINYDMAFEQSDDILNLLSMTPFAFKASNELLDELKQKSSFNCQANFLIRLYKKA